MDFKAILRLISRNRVLRRRIPQEYGGDTVYVSPDCGLKFWKPNLSASVDEVWGKTGDYLKQGDVVWDIGANLGLFAFPASHAVGKKGQVVAFEPDPFNAYLFSKSVAQKKTVSSPIDLLTIAVGEKNSIQSFWISHYSRALNHLESAPPKSEFADPSGLPRSKQTVLTISIDWLTKHFPSPNLIKIDVEGAEVSLLKGAVELLRSNTPPIFICEVRDENADAVTEIFHRYNYSLYNFEDIEQRAVDRAVWITLALPPK